jgi:hypothetical protein
MIALAADTPMPRAQSPWMRASILSCPHAPAGVNSSGLYLLGFAPAEWCGGEITHGYCRFASLLSPRRGCYCSSGRGAEATSHPLDEPSPDVAHHQPILQVRRIVTKGSSTRRRRPAGAAGQPQPLRRCPRSGCRGTCPQPLNVAGPGRPGNRPLRVEARIRGPSGCGARSTAASTPVGGSAAGGSPVR